MVSRVMPSAVEEVGENWGILKGKANAIVGYLERNETSVDVEEKKLGWLTCIRISRKENP